MTQVKTPSTDVEETRREAEELARHVPTPEKAPSEFIRWMGWILSIAVLCGLVGAVWYGLASDDLAPATLDRHDAAAALRAGPLVAPSDVDPHESPEILRVTAAPEFDPMLTGEFSGSLFVAPSEVDPHESPEILRVTATPEFDPMLTGEFSGSIFVAPSEVDPHESPEIRWAG